MPLTKQRLCARFTVLKPAGVLPETDSASQFRARAGRLRSVPQSGLYNAVPFPTHPDMNAPLEPSTAELLHAIRQGSEPARHALYQRFLPILSRWAHGRLPRGARDVADTDDLVQVSLMRTLKHLDAIESERAGSFLAYLRQILLNEVRTEMRKHRVRGEQVDVADVDLVDPALSPVEQLVGRERMRAYEAALAKLNQRQQELILMRLELGMSYPEIALETGSDADAVRMMVTRALKSLTEQLADSR